jgi:hypothetical protein
MFINILITGKMFIHLWQQIGTKRLENRIPYIVLPKYGGNKNPNLKQFLNKGGSLPQVSEWDYDWYVV